jgi:large subunit ribosomal protein L10
MAISKEKKGKVLEDLKNIFKDSGSVVFVNFHGLNVNDTTGVRKALNEKGIGYTVAKKTLTKKALGESKFEGEIPALEGELGLVYGKDIIEPAREAYSFQKKLEKKLSILGGIFEGKLMSQKDMITIAEIPPMKTLQAQFVNLINSPIQGFVMALNEIAKKKEA